MKYKFIIEQPTYGHHTYVVPEAESEEEAIALVANDNKDEYVTEQFVFDDTGPLQVVKKEAIARGLSLQQFMASRSFVPQYDSGMDIKVAALVYTDDLYIEITTGGYLLTLGNQQYMKEFTDVRGLLQLEELLYRWAVSERIFREP